MTPEIRAFEFALGLFTVLIGLAIVDVATSFHRLLRARRQLRWDPLVLLTALFALVITVGMWFDLWGVREATSVRGFFVYLALVGSFFTLFLIAAASLPDEVPEGMDLRTFYAANHRYFWILVTLFEVTYVVFGIHFLGSVWDRLPHAVILTIVSQWVAMIGIPLTLAIVRSRAVHYIGIAVLFAVLAWHYGRQTIL